MVLPLCTVIDEVSHLEVGRGVAIAEHEAHVVGPVGGCIVDAGSVLRAREEGRSSPELIAFRADVDGRPAVAAGPRGRVAVEVAGTSASVRFVAVLRGDRFIAAPLATNPAVARRTRFRARTRSVWGLSRVAGTASWVEVGAPIVVTVDPERDHEPPSLDAVIDGPGAPPVLIVDAGPGLGRELTVSTEALRVQGLARGGVEALSILLSDLPLSVATAPDPGSVIARLAENARAARAASLSRDPLVIVIGQRLATAIARGFSGCDRPSSVTTPPSWPAVPRELAPSGVLDDGDSGCPRIDDLLATNYPDIRVAQEGSAALSDALREPIAALPRIGSLQGTKHPVAVRARITRHTVALVAVLIGALTAAIWLGLFGRERSR